METKYITIPFQVERAKRISNGEEEGKIVTRDGKEVRIVCFNVRHDHYPIIGLIDEGDYESAESFSKNGSYSIEDGELDCDLFLKVPEWTTFKDGDIVTMAWENGNHYCKWISIIKVIDVFDNDICTRDYVALCIQADENNFFSIEFDCESDAAKRVRKSNEDEINKLMEGLKESKEPKAKECLKRFFGIEETPNHSNPEKTGKEYELKPFDKVLVRNSCNEAWSASLFSHKIEHNSLPYSCLDSQWRYCIPYEGNEHLLGSSNDPE